MFAPTTRSMTLTLGLLSSTISPCLMADSEIKDETRSTSMELGSTSITAQGLGATTENTGSYTTGSTSTATKLNLSIRETPQSISVVTRQEMDDFNLNTLTEAMRHTTGVVVQHNDSDRVSYSSRGYTINNFQIDGMLNTFSFMKSDADTIIYDRIEVIRGATGLTTGAGDPSGTINMIRKRPTRELQAKAGVTGAAMTTITATWMSAARWRLTGVCAGAPCWLTATANRSATTTHSSEKWPTAFWKPT